jgi:hypothetical protein
MKRVTNLVVMMALALPLAAQAQGTKPAKKQAGHARESLHEQFSGAGYGTAGCGLGSIIFGAKPGMVQIFSSTTNGIYGNQTFGITSGTSNCEIPEMGMQAAVFIEGNREVLAKDAARGQGETVTGLAAILNCDDASALGTGLQSNYEAIFSSSTNSYDTTREILKTIENNSALKASCKYQG